ncbi:hypothetical protein [Nocardia sp. NPDC051570]|uniref:hypothetical protein n=1 Tax=Nocardia sp. NPDC051570 TaxID=3364324 RepID=UPI0037989DCC
MRRLRRTCDSRIRELGLPASCGLDELMAAIAAMRGRPIRAVAVPLPVSRPCGLWISTDTEDLVFYEADTTRLRQEHIILHELGHMICGHSGEGLIDGELARMLFPDLNIQLLRSMLPRSAYDDRQETEAEVMASVLAQRARHWTARQPADTSADPSTVQRLSQSLAPRWGKEW